jgi:hypothetical protein
MAAIIKETKARILQRRRPQHSHNRNCILRRYNIIIPSKQRRLHNANNANAKTPDATTARNRIEPATHNTTGRGTGTLATHRTMPTQTASNANSFHINNHNI